MSSFCGCVGMRLCLCQRPLGFERTCLIKKNKLMAADAIELSKTVCAPVIQCFAEASGQYGGTAGKSAP